MRRSGEANSPDPRRAILDAPMRTAMLLLLLLLFHASCSAAPEDTSMADAAVLALPGDAIGDRLRAWLSDGEDLAVERLLQLVAIAPERQAAEAIAALARDCGYAATIRAAAELPGGGGQPEWEVVCSRALVPTYAAVVDANASIAKLAQVHGGHSAGFELLPVQPSAASAAVGRDR